jgi:hypothetical protein
MKVTVNNVEHDIPFNLTDVTLKRFIEYYVTYGRELDKELLDILNTDYRKVLLEKGFGDFTEADIELERNIDIDNHIDKEALSWYTFWSGCDFFEAKDMPDVQPLLAQYRMFKQLLSQEEEETLAVPKEIDWNDEKWSIQNHVLDSKSVMTFDEVVTSKEVIRQVNRLGLGRWEALPYLCAIFFRKKNEQFDEEFVQEGSDRMNLMELLPMKHALQVAFFLSICVNIWKSTSASLIKEGEETASLN